MMSTLAFEVKPVMTFTRRPIRDLESWSRARLEEFAAGEDRHLSAFMLAWDRPVRSAVTRRLRRSWGLNPDEVEDAVQLAFLRVWQTADRFPISGASPGAFITTCAVDAARGIRRTAYRRREQRITSDAFQSWFDNQPSHEPTPLEAILEGEDRGEIRNGVRSLPSPERDVAEALFLEGSSPREVAASLGMSSAAVSNHAASAALKLGEILAGFAGTGRVQVVAEVEADVEQEVEAVLRTALLDDDRMSPAAAQRHVEAWTGIRFPVRRIRKLLESLRIRTSTLAGVL